VEAALRLRRLAGDRVQMTLVSPDEELVYRPLAVREPFARAGARRYPGRGWHSEIYEQPPWPADEKVISEELGPYLRSHESAAPRP
jgi:hypothetical protein